MKITKTSNKEKYRILEQLFALQRLGIKPGLERTVSLLKSCGNPHDTYPSLHVAGTNGKGAVCCVIASVLTEAGYKTGLYTSPHILDFNERIRINGEKIPDDDIIRIAESLLSSSFKVNGTFFEITTTMAFKYFAEKEVDIAILETGMGGKFDSTNVVTPLISVITPVSIDHTEYLGNSLKEIANEKAGIIKPGVDIVLAQNPDIVSNVVCSRANRTNSNILNPDDFVSFDNIKYKRDFTIEMDIIFSGEKISNTIFPISGRHQVQNLQTALTALHSIKDEFFFNIDNIKSGLENLKKNTGYSSRIELIRNEPPVVLDVAHNPSAVKSSIDTLRISGYNKVKWQIVFGAMNDKNVESILEILQPICSKFIATKPKTARAMDTNKIVDLASQAGIIDIVEMDNVESAMLNAFNESKPTLIIGSFYMAEEAFRFLNKSGL